MDTQFFIDLTLWAFGMLVAFLVVELDYKNAKKKENKK